MVRWVFVGGCHVFKKIVVMRKNTLCLGGNGFIGHRMARALKKGGHFVTVADIKEYEYGENDFSDENIICDLRDVSSVEKLFTVYKWDEIYCFACQMGGAQYVFTGDNDSDIMSDSALININILKAMVKFESKAKVFYSSSACIYPQELQRISNNSGLKESDAYPAHPDSDYGFEKLFSEHLFNAFARNKGIDIRIARFHNIFGVEGTWKGGREKAPAAMCRKVAEKCQSKGDVKALMQDLIDGEMSIEVLGDGLQTRSFLYIDECIEGIRRLMNSDCKEPVNIGSDEMVSINELAKMVIEISGKNISIKNVESKALGVRGRNSDNDFIYSQLGWKPNYPLKNGLEKTYEWISKQVYKSPLK